jgi:malonyl-CoA/methylmalonyl-CoA synthetase
MLRIVDKARLVSDRTAIVSGNRSFSYADLLQASGQFAGVLLDQEIDLREAHVAFMVEPGFEYVKVQWGIWRAGGVAVPLCITHPLPSLTYVLDDADITAIVVSPRFESILLEYAALNGIRVVLLNDDQPAVEVALPLVDAERRAMILYTSGTTNKPKGVVTTHRNIEAQIEALVNSWEWNQQDHILCVLPLHHVHGIINVVSCALWSGALCEFIPAFSADYIFRLFAQGRINLFMAVPTIYFKLIEFWEKASAEEQESMKESMKDFRLMVCGSAALPVSIMEKWQKLSGHLLLERYGMTEIGMAISNPYRGERKAGYVGLPLPGVDIRLVNEQYVDVPAGELGEILVKGDNVFLEYWRRPEATAESFREGRWFKTGDVAVVEAGYYRIMGRNSVDMIKSGGYKISALEIEEELRKYNAIEDCAVVGIENEEWGELIVAAIVTKGEVNTEELNGWLKERMASYKLPRRYLILPELPRNAIGKVTKNEVKKLF